MMNANTIQILLDLNRRFYTNFSSSFAATRRRIQPGVRRILAGLPDSETDKWLDLGCGSGALAAEWLEADRQSTYAGIDFSQSLLREAEQALSNSPGRERITFFQADLASPGWARAVSEKFSGALSFAVLHHLPSVNLRQNLIQQVCDLLPTDGRFYLSVWQFQHSPKLMARRVAWELAGLSDDDIEPGDTLLDWRADEPRQTGEVGLRYVHLFQPAELTELAASSGFQVVETFESDGQGGNLSLYQVWSKTA
jgi:tRNA (uracil-5-)-methyltransferase TRM9